MWNSGRAGRGFLSQLWRAVVRADRRGSSAYRRSAARAYNYRAASGCSTVSSSTNGTATQKEAQ